MERSPVLPEKFAQRRDALLASIFQRDITGCTLFIGDSGFDPARYWVHFAEDLAGKYAENVAIGGTRVSDWELLKNDLIFPARPKNIVMHLGGNDFNTDRHTPWRVFDDLTALIRSLREQLPETHIYVFALEPKPQKSRIFHTNYSRNTLNAMLTDWCPKEANVRFVDTAKAFVLPNGSVDETLFKEDLIHPADRDYPEIFLPLLEAAGYGC